MSARPRSSQSDTQLEKISFSSTGKELQEMDHTKTTSQNQITHTHRTTSQKGCSKEISFLALYWSCEANEGYSLHFATQINH